VASSADSKLPSKPRFSTDSIPARFGEGCHIQYEHAIRVLLESRPQRQLPSLRCKLRRHPSRWACLLTCCSVPGCSSPSGRWLIRNAQVGIARAASIRKSPLSGSGGWQSTQLAPLLNAPSLFWSLGADALEPIFEVEKPRQPGGRACRLRSALWRIIASPC